MDDRLREEDLVGLRGRFVDTGGQLMATPRTKLRPDEPCPIGAGPWPYPKVGGRQAQCNGCKRLVGVSSESWALHVANREIRPILCSECLVALVNMVREGPRFTCPVCAATSFHPKDIEQGYCGRCHEFTGGRP